MINFFNSRKEAELAHLNYIPEHSQIQIRSGNNRNHFKSSFNIHLQETKLNLKILKLINSNMVDLTNK